MNTSPIYSRGLRLGVLDLGFLAARVRFGPPSPLLFDSFDRNREMIPRAPVVMASSVKLARAFLTDLAKRKLQQEIRGFRDLPENWDSYGSGPISDLTIINALAGLDALARHGLVPEDASPTSDESILFELHLGEREVIIEFFKSGGTVVLEKDKDTKKLSEVEAGRLDETIAGLRNVPV